MANVTFGTPTAQRLQGNYITKIFVVNGATGSTLNTNMVGLLWVDAMSFNQAGTASLITGISYNATTGVVTFTSSAPMVNEVIMVIALKG